MLKPGFGTCPGQGREILWWGHFDPDYSRNRILRQVLLRQGWRLRDFIPSLSRLGDLEADARGVAPPALVWVPCFRQRDVAAARRWSRRHGVPLVFDPLISAFDKQVYERRKFSAQSFRGRWLKNREGQLLRSVDLLLADTGEHARFFRDAFGVDEARLRVVPVGAEEELFFPEREESATTNEVCQVLFFGSFIALQGPQYIVEAARIYQGPPVQWRFIGKGPLLEECRKSAGTLPNVRFDPWVPYAALAEEIRKADILLGIFGETSKAGRVIPNKVFQAMACGKPVITRRSPAYPDDMLEGSVGGLVWVEPGNPQELAMAVAGLAASGEARKLAGRKAHGGFLSYFGSNVLGKCLEDALTSVVSG